MVDAGREAGPEARAAEQALVEAHPCSGHGADPGLVAPRRPDEPAEWYDAALFNERDAVLTAEELTELNEAVVALLRPYRLRTPSRSAAGCPCRWPCSTGRCRWTERGCVNAVVKDYFRSMSFTTVESRWSDVWLAATARGTTICGDFLAATALALALQGAGAGGLAVSGLLLAATLPLVVLAPLTGRLADRVDSRTLLVTVGLAQAVICALLAVVDHPVAVVGLVALLACGLAVTQPCLAALLPAMVRPADLPRASAHQPDRRLPRRARRPGAGRPAGGAVRHPRTAACSTPRPTWRWWRPACCCGPAEAVGEPPPPRPRRDRPVGRAGRAWPSGHPGRSTRSWRLRRDPLLLVMVVSTAAVIAAIGAINVIEVFFIRETLDGSATMYGLVSGRLDGRHAARRLAGRPARPPARRRRRAGPGRADHARPGAA